MTGTGLQKWLVRCALLCAVLLASSCRTLSGTDLERIREHRAIFEAHAADESLPIQAREIAGDAVDTLWLVGWKAAGEVPPADVLERIGAE